MDGETGEIVINPDEYAAERMERRLRELNEKQRQLAKFKTRKTVTKDGRTIQLCCNIGSAEEVEAVRKVGGEGIGLFRTELVFLQRDTYPTEEEQFSMYQAVAAQMDGKRVVFRTLDIGVDKQAGYLGLERQENPAMGLRAIRFCLTNPEIFRTQLRALYRASVYGRIAIMFPMITDVWEVRECKRICGGVQEELKSEGLSFDENVELGVMIETPAAVMISDLLAKEVDFFSVGTNDLTQYMLVCDRQNERMEPFFDPYHQAVLRAIRIATDNAHREGRWIGICGELAADPKMTERFLAMGIDELSVSPGKVLPLRKAICEMDVSNPDTIQSNDL
jgi:phosphotransferase system enzyme I (PtsI)